MTQKYDLTTTGELTICGCGPLLIIAFYQTSRTSHFIRRAEVLAYLHLQISPISCNVVGSILHVLRKNTNTAIIVGYRWTGVGGHHALDC